MFVTVLISTYDRLEPLRKCIKSIIESEYKNVEILVVVDGNRELFIKLLAEPIDMVLNKERRDYVFSMNKGLREMEIKDAVLYASDDLIFAPDCISQAVAALQKHFPDGDGLVGLAQTRITKGAFGLMGRKFIERFPKQQVFYPKYIHYAGDTELEQYAVFLKRFYWCKTAFVTHPTLKDNTYILGQKIRSHDSAIYRARQAKGLLWGKEFESLNNEVKQ